MVTQVDLYRFTEQGSTDVWTVTSADFELDYNAGSGVETYTPISIDRSEIEQKKDLSLIHI